MESLTDRTANPPDILGNFRPIESAQLAGALALVLHRTDDSHRCVVYGSRQSRLHLNLFVKMASACLCGVPPRHPASIILGDISWGLWFLACDDR